MLQEEGGWRSCIIHVLLRFVTYNTVRLGPCGLDVGPDKNKFLSPNLWNNYTPESAMNGNDVVGASDI